MKKTGKSSRRETPSPRPARGTDETLEECRANLREAVTLVLEANGTLSEEELRGRNVFREPLRLRE